MKTIPTCLFLFVLSVVGAVAQGPQQGPPMAFPLATNLKVLPKTLSSEELKKIMFAWSGDLGVHCVACHTISPSERLPNGRPKVDFADDSRPEEADARRMAALMEELNRSRNLKSGKVSCGTCHRGRFTPEPYVAAAPGKGPGEGR